MSPRDLVINNLGMIALALLWGTMIPSLVVLLEIWDPFFVAAIRYSLAIVPFLLLLKLVERGPIVPAGIPLWRLATLGLIGYGIFSPMFSIGLAHTHPLTAVIIVAMAPIVGSIVGRVMFGIPFDRRLIPAIVLAVTGAGLATYDPDASSGIPFALTGSELLLIGAMCCWNWYSLAAQRWLAGYSQLRITALTASSGGILLTFIWLGASAIGVAEFPPAAPRDSDILLVAWIILGCIIGGILLWNWGVKKFGIVVPNLYMNLVPLVAIGLSALIGYVPTTLQLCGGALVVGGILASQLARLVSSKQTQATQSKGDPA